MNRGFLLLTVLLFGCAHAVAARVPDGTFQLSDLSEGQRIEGFRVTNIYADSSDEIVGVKFVHADSGAPIYVLRMETVPQVFMWVDTPAASNQGLPHALEHLLAGKGTTGRYSTLLKTMRLSQSAAATALDFNFYSFSSGSGMGGFMEQFHAWLQALYFPDFTDAEAEREFYHFDESLDSTTKKRQLIEQGTVYEEERAKQGIWRFYYELNKRVFGRQNAFAFDSSGSPEEMRTVTPEIIRQYHKQHYRLGPSTGFIFALNAKENLGAFLRRISAELRDLPRAVPGPDHAPNPLEPKYPIEPSSDEEPGIYPFPSQQETAPGELEFAWKAAKVQSPLELKLLQLLARGFGQGPPSLLYRSMIDSATREIESRATSVSANVFMRNSPWFPVLKVSISGISGDQISTVQIERIRSHILNQLRDLAELPDNSARLLSFNRLLMARAAALRREETVWTKSAPLFGFTESGTDWKDYLERLEMDPSFSRRIAEDPVWDAIDRQLGSGQNIWRELITHFDLLRTPYATASVPSSTLLKQYEQQKQSRLTGELAFLMERYHSDDPQEALAAFAQGEAAKTREIDKIEASVPRPTFTDHPPLTPDDDIRYRQFRLEGVPVTSILFERPPTIDIGVSFDLSNIPRRYYKYLPIIPRLLDSAGLREGRSVLPYPALLNEIQGTFQALSVAYSSDALSKRAELALRASMIDADRAGAALTLLRRIALFNDVSVQNVSRLRDIVSQRLADDAAFTSQSEEAWLPGLTAAFRHQDDRLFLALNSHFTQAHWDDRLKWMLHKPATPQERAELAAFVEIAMQSFAHRSRAEISQWLSKSTARGIQSELVDYWRRELFAVPDISLDSDLRRLAREVQEDLQNGPENTILEIKRLQSMMLTRHAIKVDISGDEAAVRKLTPLLAGFLRSFPASKIPARRIYRDNSGPVWRNLRRRYASLRPHFPVHIGLVTTAEVPAAMVFTADFPGYEQLDHKSLLHALSSNIFAGAGPQSLYMKTWEAGLAYNNGVSADPSERSVQYYADRVPDIPSLIRLVDSVLSDDHLSPDNIVDYVFSQTFAIPRSMMSFTQRGRAFALDLRDGDTPAKVRRYSRAILALKRMPGLANEIVDSRRDAIGNVTLNSRYARQQKDAESIFFFMGPGQTLSDAADRLHLAELIRIWPSDYWVDEH